MLAARIHRAALDWSRRMTTRRPRRCLAPDYNIPEHACDCVDVCRYPPVLWVPFATSADKIAVRFEDRERVGHG